MEGKGRTSGGEALADAGEAGRRLCHATYVVVVVHGLFVPWTIRTLLDCSYHGLFVPSLDFSYLDCSYHPWTFRTLDDSYHVEN